MVELKEKDLDSFFDVPGAIYPPEFNFVSQLKSDLKRFLSTSNPLFKNDQDFSFFTAYKNGKLAGRIVTHIHHESNKVYQQKRSYFGYFDCINDQEVAALLLNKAEDFARKNGCLEVVGNFNLTAMQQIGVMTKIHKAYHYTDQVYSPEYLADLLQTQGYTPFFPMKTHEVDLVDFNPEILLGPKQLSIINDPRFTFSTLKDGSFDEMMEAMRLCLNNGFSENPMFIPLTKEEIYFQAKDMMLVVDEKITVVAKYDNKPVGVVICIPNLNPFLKNTKSKIGLMTLYHYFRFKLKRDSAIIIFYSVYKDFHSKGLNGVMLNKVLKALKVGGYKKMGGTWISDENAASLRQAEKLGAKTMHELHLFRKSL